MLVEYLPLLASLAGLYAGALIARYGRRSAAPVIEGVVIVGVVALAALHLLPEAYEVAGPGVLVVAAVGFVFPLLFEGRLRGEGPAHASRLLLGVLFTGLALHAMMDGAALGGAHHDHGEGAHSTSEQLLALAIMLHRLPLGLWLEHETHRRGAGALGFGLVTVLALATLVGYGLGTALAAVSSSGAHAYFQAFVVGSLLHVVLHPLPGWFGRALGRRRASASAARAPAVVSTHAAEARADTPS